MNAFLPWLGGKRRLAATIAERLEALPHRRYVEPFAGAAHVFFRKAPAAEEVLADADAELVVPGRAWACGVCFTPERSGSLLLAYYLTTALLTITVLGVLAVYLVVLARHYGRK